RHAFAPPPWPGRALRSDPPPPGRTAPFPRRSPAPSSRSRPSRDGLRVPPAVRVVRRACALGRNHRGAERMLGSTGRAERRAVVRLLQPAQDLAADAVSRLEGLDGADIEPTLGVPVA